MSTYIEYYSNLRGKVDAHLNDVIDRHEPVSVYDPARYILSGGGKRIRPVLVLLSAEACGARADDAIDAAVSVEILHNFTLVHDDIMDNADQRRGRATVHKKWDSNTAILTGDNLIGIAYRTLLQTQSGDIRRLCSIFTDGMIEVCEGQGYDKEFEARDIVTEDEYFMMIGKKTGRLVSMSAELGAVIGDAAEASFEALSAYAHHIGRAFQVQDDLLDVIADEKDFGKSIGGDILEGKKTFLLVHAMGKAAESDLELLKKVSTRRAEEEDIPKVTDLYERLGIIEEARTRVRQDTDTALQRLGSIPETPARDMLRWFAEMLLQRTK